MTDIAEPTLRLTPQPAGLKHRFYAIVKPVGSLCNRNCTLDFWYSRDFGKVHVDLFETAVAQSLGLPSQRCITAEFCGKSLAVEHNGDVFSCDHYVYPEYRVGNIHTTHWSEMAYGEPQLEFGFAKRDTLPAYYRKCPHLKLYWGECPKNRLVRSPSGEAGLNYLCPGLKKFYAHIQRDMLRFCGALRPIMATCHPPLATDHSTTESGTPNRSSK